MEAANGHLQLAKFAKQILSVGQKLVQGRVKQPYCHRQSGHLTEDADEVTALQRQKSFEGLLASADAIRKDHLAHGSKPLITKEHVFSAA